MLYSIRFWLPGCGDITLFRTVPWLAWGARLDSNTPNTKLFPPHKSCSTTKLFFFFKFGEIQNNAHRVRSMHSRSSLFSVVFMWLISPTQKFKLEKSTINTKEWAKSRFDEILQLWIFILDYFVAPAFCLILVRYGSILIFAFAQYCLTKKLEEIPILHMFACLVSIHSKMWIK